MQTKPSSYDAAIWKAFGMVRQQAPLSPEEVRQACDSLLASSPSQRELILRNSSRLPKVEMARLLVEDADRLRLTQPTRMLELAELALQVLEHEESYPSGLVADARAHAWASVANAHRILDRSLAAQEGLARADASRRQGTGDPLLEAHILSLSADLLIEQDQHPRAIETVRSACRIYDQVGDEHLFGRMLVQLAHIYRESGQLADAVRSNYLALGKLEPGRDGLLTLITVHNLAGALAQLGEVKLAIQVLSQASPLFDLLPGEMPVLKTRWLEAELLAQVGRQEEALAIYESIRHGLLLAGQEKQAASAMLDQAVLHAELGQWNSVRSLAEEAYPVFLSRDIGREATAALLLFVEAAELEAAAVPLLLEAQRRLRKA